MLGFISMKQFIPCHDGQPDQILDANPKLSSNPRELAVKRQDIVDKPLITAGCWGLMG
jgi:hypothetical protein